MSKKIKYRKKQYNWDTMEIAVRKFLGVPDPEIEKQMLRGRRKPNENSNS